MLLVENLMKLALLGAVWVMYLLVLLSVLSIATMVERWWFFRRNVERSTDLGDDLLQFVRKRDFEGAQKMLQGRKSIEAEVIGQAFPYLSSGTGSILNAVDSALAKRRKDMERGINFLGTLGSNAPFIGLFGTVIGVIEAFHFLGVGTDDAAMANVMAGIAEALIATGVGLGVAIPAVVAFNVFQAKIGAVEASVEAVTKQLCAESDAMARAGGGAPQPRGEHTPASEPTPDHEPDHSGNHTAVAHSDISALARAAD
jgi:biopolymer transport protein ExbB/TolQ